MPIETINGVGIFLEEFGSGDPLVLVHGSWADHMEWPFIVPGLAQRFRVVVYDRRGHSQSERLPAQAASTRTSRTWRRSSSAPERPHTSSETPSAPPSPCASPPNARS